MIDLVLPDTLWTQIEASLRPYDDEACAVAFASTSRHDRGVRLLGRTVIIPEAADYILRSRTRVQLSPHFVARVAAHARITDASVVFIHSHVSRERPDFSPTDQEGEAALKAFLDHRHPKPHHASVVVSPGGVAARLLGSSTMMRVRRVGAMLTTLSSHVDDFSLFDMSRFDRQVRALGNDGQRILGRLRIGVVGAGGTGSLILQQLAHLGVSEFVVVDPDTIEGSNLNRVVGATETDIGAPKVHIAARLIGAVTPNATVTALQGDVTHVSVAQRLLTCDIIFGCTDSHGSRAILQQLAYQYYIPCIDMGTTITTSEGSIAHIIGRVQLLSPGLACFTCGGLLDSQAVRRDLMNEFERATDPYIVGGGEPAPAVISINATVSSLAITMLLAVVTALPVPARYLIYDALETSLRSIRAVSTSLCVVCSEQGCLGRGDDWPIAGRLD